MTSKSLSTLAAAISLCFGSAAFAAENAGQTSDESTVLHSSSFDQTGSQAAHRQHASEKGTVSTTTSANANIRHDAIAFGEIDRNRDGFVAVDELRGTIEDTLRRWDTDDDNRLDRTEFAMYTRGEFTTLDSNADGFISRAELRTLQPLDAQFADFDRDRDNRLSRDEHRMLVEAGEWNRPVMREFSQFDRDGDGYLSRDEAAAFQPLATVFSIYDTDRDGQVERAEYDLFLAQRGAEYVSTGELDEDFADGNLSESD